jgi:hypothetical protein
MAVTVNIDSQIVVKTATQWAADSTVYSAKRILVTSDEYYGATDQRKFKIANGTDTWSNLDYMPIGTGGASGLLHGTATQVSAGVYTTTISGVSAYTTGDVYAIKFDSVNDNGSTININSLGAVNIYKNSIVPLESGDIKANQEIIIVYDGTNFQAIGLTSAHLLAYVHNAEGSVISKGQVVYAFGSSGNKMSVKLARADADTTSAKTIGMVYDSTIGIGAEGYIIIQGTIVGVNTAAYSAGDTLYLSASTFGGLTNVKPYAPDHLVYVGVVERANAGNGQIYVRCQNGYELDEIHNVDLITTPPVNNDLLAYNSSLQLWSAKSINTILPNAVTGTGTSNEITYWATSGTVGSLTTATYPSLTELSYVKGVTSDIQTQINNKIEIGDSYFTIPFNSAQQNPADNVTYYLGSLLAAVPGTGATARRWYVPVDCTLIGYTAHIAWNPGTSEQAELYFRINDTTDVTISTTIAGNANFNAYSSALNTNLSAGDLINCKLVCPTWATNPTSMNISVIGLFKRR